MPTLIKQLYDGVLSGVSYTADSLADAAQHEPDDGIYTVASTKGRYGVLKLSAHLDRLEDSAKRADIVFKADRPAIKQALRTMINASGYEEVRFRVTVPRSTPDTLILSIEPFTSPPQSVIKTGVRCITAANSARHNAAAKTTDWMHQRQVIKDAMPDDIYDTFLLDDNGYILEGLGSNFYAVLDGVLRTAGDGVLRGISQQTVLEVAPSIIPVQLDAIHVDNLPQCTDCFLTSSTRGIIPVIEIDGVQIGNGQPGDITIALRAAYEAWMAAHLEIL
ncbi:MAG: aminotransferase class IV [Aggregatilineales bacterium]